MASSAAADFMPNRHRYQGNEYRKEAGLNWMDFHARQYDPQIGRFLGVDPLADAGGQQVFSPYAAMGNNPVAMTDPGGMMHDVFQDAWILQYIFKPPMMFSPGTMDFLMNGGNGGIPQDFLEFLSGGNEQKFESFSDADLAEIAGFLHG